MQKLMFALIFALVGNFSLQAQGRTNDIPVRSLPKEVKEVLVQYVDILRNSTDLDDCAEKVIAVLGGSLVNDDGTDVRNTVKPFSLKKDLNDVQFYADPVKITRVNVSFTNKDGYGETALRGKTYKIWIDKADKSYGMPAPITIVVPEGHPSIKTPKVIGIGSL